MQPECDPKYELFPPRESRRDASPPKSAWRRGRGAALVAGTGLLAVGLMVAFGCRSTSVPSSSSKPFVGVTLRLACPAGASAARQAVERHAADWTAQTGARLEWLGPSAAGDAPADLRLIAPAELAHHVARGLRPVPESLRVSGAPYQWSGLFRLYREKLLVWDGKPYALPLLGDATLCVYRRDLCAEADHAEAFQRKYHRSPTAPATWQEFADLAEYFREAWHRPSLPPLPESSDDLDRRYYAVAAPFAQTAESEERFRGKALSEAERDAIFSFHYDLRTGTPRVDGVGFLAALQMLQRLQRCRPTGTAARPTDAFRDGKAVLALVTLADLATLQAPGSAVRNRFAICPVPGSAEAYDAAGKRLENLLPAGNVVPYLGAGGWLGVVPADGTQPDAAWALLADLSGPTVSAQILGEPSWGGGPFREGHLDPRGNGWLSYDLPEQETPKLLAGLRQAVTPALVNPVLKLRTPDQRPHETALVEEVRKALSDPTVPAERAMRAVARRWREMDAGKDEAERRAAYRLSVGLLR